MDELISQMGRVTAPDFENVDLGLLVETYRQALALKVVTGELNEKCPSCLQDAYWIMKVAHKKQTHTLAEGNGLTGHRIVKNFTIQSVKYGILNPANITDAQCEELIRSNAGHLEYFQPIGGGE